MNERPTEMLIEKHRNDLQKLIQALNNGGDPDQDMQGNKQGFYKLNKIRCELPADRFKTMTYQ